MPDSDRIPGEHEFLEAALGELEHLWRTRRDGVPDTLSSLPRFMAMLQRYGSRMVAPFGLPRTLHPATAWQLDPATGTYIDPTEEETHRDR